MSDRELLAAALKSTSAALYGTQGWPYELAEHYADALLPVVDRIASARAAAALRAAAEDRTTVLKLTPVESLTCFIVKLEDLFHRADALDPPS